MVVTRSQAKRSQFEVNIDFDYASACWRANKKPIAQGCYKYICGHVLKNGKRCNRPVTCRLHQPLLECGPLNEH